MTKKRHHTIAVNPKSSREYDVYQTVPNKGKHSIPFLGQPNYFTLVF